MANPFLERFNRGMKFRLRFSGNSLEKEINVLIQLITKKNAAKNEAGG
jgi:hypothetical protein